MHPGFSLQCSRGGAPAGPLRCDELVEARCGAPAEVHYDEAGALRCGALAEARCGVLAEVRCDVLAEVHYGVLAEAVRCGALAAVVRCDEPAAVARCDALAGEVDVLPGISTGNGSNVGK
jgi:hypothetical protein